MKISGIYKIQSKIKPERIYIGSAVDIARRWQLHLSNLNNNKHHSQKLQNHVSKYGINDLIFIIIEPCLPEFLIIREQYYIDSLKPYFNVCKKANSCLGVKRSDDCKLKLSKLHKGRKHTKEHIENHRRSIVGRKLTNEHILKLKKYSGENHHCFGKHLSEETKKKISDANKGRGMGFKKGIPRGLGTKKSDETKRKMSLATKKYWADKKSA